jgi:hypothetical protein
LRFKYIEEWGKSGDEWWDSAAEKTGLFEGKVSIFIYNFGFAHSSNKKIPLFLEWWKKAVQRPGANPPKILFYLSIATMQGQRNKLWDDSDFKRRDREARDLFRAAGFAILEMSGPTQSRGVDITGEGGSDGFHYPLQTVGETIAMTMWNTVCNFPFNITDSTSVAAWYAAGGKLDACG